MKYILSFLTISVLLVACKGNLGSPKGTVAAFIEAMKKGDIDAVKKLITKSDVSLLDMAQSVSKSLGGSTVDMSEKMKNDFIEKSKNVSYSIQDEKVDGDNAQVNVEIKENDKTTIAPFKLLKEDGSWKISLLSTGLNMGGSHNGNMNDANINISDSIRMAMDSLKNINLDSLSDKVKKGMDKFKELQEKNPEAIKKMEDAMKKMQDAGKQQ